MMIRAAGGPGMISPIDFGERRRPRLTPTTWAAVAIVVAAHVGVGVALYLQRFELQTVEQPEPPAILTTFFRPEPLPQPKPLPKPEPDRKPPAANTVIHETVTPERATETVTAARGEEQPTGPITFTETIKDPQPEATGTQPEPPRGPAVIRNPEWISRPSAEQMARAYPDRALQRGIGGSASLQCVVRSGGGLTECAVASETPAGQGFGRAATQLSRYFRISPRTVDGAAVEGSRVNVTVRFNAPQ